MGESIAEATISKWLKGPGDHVEKDEVILEISTDKVDSEIPAPAAGVLSEVLFSEGDVVPVKEKIATIDTDATASNGAPVNGAPAKQAAKTEVPQVSQPATAQPKPVQTAQSTTPTRAPEQRPSSATSNPPARESGSKFFSPLVRSLADKYGVSSSELETLRGSGQNGRVTKQDLLEFVESRGFDQQKPAQSAPQTSAPQAPQAKPSAPAPTPTQYRAPTEQRPTGEWGDDGKKIVPMDNMRQLIADHMVRSKHTSPHVYSVQEVDCSRISAWRTKHKDAFKKSEGFGLSFTPFFLEAAVRGLKAFPLLNSSVEGKTIILKRDINLGCAVALGNSGLIVPVIKKADERNFVGIARSLTDLALRARDKKLVPDEVMGGTFTVTNPGVFGTMIGTPIINQPQVAILCLGQIKKRPVVVDDMIAIREICYLTLSYDHRIIDGSLGGQYLAFIREYIENWDMDRPLY